VPNLQAAFEAPQNKVADRVVFAGIGSLSVSVGRQRGRGCSYYTGGQEFATSHRHFYLSQGISAVAVHSVGVCARAILLASLPHGRSIGCQEGGSIGSSKIGLAAGQKALR
jgi:hypothetical protein